MGGLNSQLCAYWGRARAGPALWGAMGQEQQGDSDGPDSDGERWARSQTATGAAPQANKGWGPQCCEGQAPRKSVAEA